MRPNQMDLWRRALSQRDSAMSLDPIDSFARAELPPNPDQRVEQIQPPPIDEPPIETQSGIGHALMEAIQAPTRWQTAGAEAAMQLGTGMASWPLSKIGAAATGIQAVGGELSRGMQRDPDIALPPDDEYQNVLNQVTQEFIEQGFNPAAAKQLYAPKDPRVLAAKQRLVSKTRAATGSTMTSGIIRDMMDQSEQQIAETLTYKPGSSTGKKAAALAAKISHPFEAAFETMVWPAKKVGEAVGEVDPVAGWFTQLGAELLTFKGLHSAGKVSAKGWRKARELKSKIDKLRGAENPLEQAKLGESFLNKLENLPPELKPAMDAIEQKTGMTPQDVVVRLSRDERRRLAAQGKPLELTEGTREYLRKQKETVEQAKKEMTPEEKRMTEMAVNERRLEADIPVKAIPPEPIKAEIGKPELVETEPGIVERTQGEKTEIRKDAPDGTPVVEEVAPGNQIALTGSRGKKTTLELADGKLTEGSLDVLVKDHYRDLSIEESGFVKEYVQEMTRIGAKEIMMPNKAHLQRVLAERNAELAALAKGKPPGFSGKPLVTKAPIMVKRMRGKASSKAREIGQTGSEIQSAISDLIGERPDEIRTEAFEFLEDQLRAGLEEIKIPEVRNKNFMAKLEELNRVTEAKERGKLMTVEEAEAFLDERTQEVIDWLQEKGEIDHKEVMGKLDEISRMHTRPELAERADRMFMEMNRTLSERKQKDPTLESPELPGEEMVDISPAELFDAEEMRASAQIDKILQDTMWDSMIAEATPGSGAIYIPGFTELTAYWAKRRQNNIKVLEPNDILNVEKIHELIGEGETLQEFLTRSGATKAEMEYFHSATAAYKKTMELKGIKQMRVDATKVEADFAEALAPRPESTTGFIKDMMGELDASQARVEFWQKGESMPKRQYPKFDSGDPTFEGEIAGTWRSPNRVWEKATDVNSRPVIDWMMADMAIDKNVSNFMRWQHERLKAFPKAKERIEKFSRENIDVRKTQIQLMQHEALKRKYEGRGKLSEGEQKKLDGLNNRIGEYKKQIEDKVRKAWDSEAGKKIIREEPSTRIALELGGKLPEWAKTLMSEAEKAAVIEMRNYFEAAAARFKDQRVPMKSGPYVSHLWDMAINQRDVRLQDRVFKKQKNSDLLKFQHQTSEVVPFPDIHTIMESYIPRAERKMAYNTVLQRYENMRGEMTPKAQKFWDDYSEANIHRPPPGTHEMLVNKAVNFEYMRVLAMATGVAYKHLYKLPGTLVEHGPVSTIKAVPRVMKVPAQALARRLGKKGPMLELDLYREFVSLSELVKAFDEVPGVRNKFWDAAKGLASSPVTLIEAFDNGMNIFAAMEHAKSKGMTPQEAYRATWDSILHVNFRAGKDQPLWAKKPGVRPFTMFQMTPFKLMEFKLDLIQNAFSGKKDAFGTNIGAKAIRYALIVGTAETIARQFFDTSVLELFIHPPFMQHLLEAVPGGYEVHEPALPMSPILQYVQETQGEFRNKERHGGGFGTAFLKHVTEFPQQKKWYRAYKRDIPSDYGDSIGYYLAGAKKISQSKKKGRGRVKWDASGWQSQTKW